MQGQSWIATLVFTLIAFGGGFLAGLHGTGGSPKVPVAGAAPPPRNAGGIGLQASCYFSPGSACTAALLDEIRSASVTLELQGHALTSSPIAQAILEAHRRGVRVTVVLDAVQASERREQVLNLVHAGVPVYVDAKHGAADNRIILIDDRVLITGSFNFTDAADQNAENLLVIRDQAQLQSAYEENFRVHLAHARPFEG